MLATSDFLILIVGDGSRYLVLFGRIKKGEEPMGPMVPPGRKPKGSVDETPANKKPMLRAENTDALEDITDLPRGTLMTCVAGVELQPEDVGAAIQFLEFCRLFGKVVMESTQ